MTRTSAPEQPTLVRRAMHEVTEHIREHGLRVGDSLPGESHFASKLSVSRAVMREAFGALAALRLLDVGNGRKPRVGAMDGSAMAASLTHGVTTAQITVAEAWDVRRTIEARIVALSAERRTPEQAEEILGHARAMARTDDIEEVTRHDLAFHRSIARASRNALFIQIVESFEPLMASAALAAWRSRAAGEDRALMLQRHLSVAEAIRDGDPRRATAAMHLHFDDAVGDVLTDRSEERPGRDQ